MISSLKHYERYQLKRDILLKTKKSNPMSSPKISSISINLSKKEGLLNSNKFFPALFLLSLITNQKPIIRKAKKSISNFKLRESKAIGISSLLRNNKLFFFLDKLIFIIISQLFDLRSKPLKVNKNTLSMGITDISVFPDLESQYEILKESQGIALSINLSNKNKISSKIYFSGLKIAL